MTQIRCIENGRLYYLDEPPLYEGGEGKVHSIRGEPLLLAKKWKKPTPERSAKIKAMIANPPVNPTAALNHPAYAWPIHVFGTPDGKSIDGFLMPRSVKAVPLYELYNPRSRRLKCPGTTTQFLYQTAANIAGVVRAIHSKGYVIGDVNSRNFVVYDSALVTVLDTDSFQVKDPRSGKLHLCGVTDRQFMAPELWAAGRLDIERHVEQDYWGLGVMIFLLLMEGNHPFQTRFTGTGEAPRIEDNVRAGHFAFGSRNNLHQPPPMAPSYDILNDELKTLFNRCFVEGYANPSARPTPREWKKALQTAASDLIACTKKSGHFYGKHLGSNCPWCVRMEAGHSDPFPSKLPIIQTQVQKPPSVKRGNGWWMFMVIVLFVIAWYMWVASHASTIRP